MFLPQPKNGFFCFFSSKGKGSKKILRRFPHRKTWGLGKNRFSRFLPNQKQFFFHSQPWLCLNSTTEPDTHTQLTTQGQGKTRFILQKALQINAKMRLQLKSSLPAIAIGFACHRIALCWKNTRKKNQALGSVVLFFGWQQQAKQHRRNISDSDKKPIAIALKALCSGSAQSPDI